MAFGGMSALGIVLAAVAGFLFGGVWYGIFSRQWMAATGIKESDVSGGWQKNAVPFIIAFVGLLIMATVLAGIIGHLGPGQVTVRNGIISGAFCWVGFVVTTLTVNNAFQGARTSLTFIDGGHWLGVLLIQGAIIGLFGV